MPAQVDPTDLSARIRRVPSGRELLVHAAIRAPDADDIPLGYAGVRLDPVDALLRLNRFRYGQGYLFGEPQPQIAAD
jgi:EAL domain-containing protein (putative c-di-GMP-specific phosphodiesterase class I)